MTDLPDLRLCGADILQGGHLRRGDLTIGGGRILATASGPGIDLSGYLVLPGIVDLHGDTFERHIAPRPSAPFPLVMGLASTDRDAAAHGVTTAFLAQSWSWEGGARGPDAAEALAAALADYRPRGRTDLRLQIRYETHELDSADRLLLAVDRFSIGAVIFNDHLPEALEMWERRPLDVELWARRSGRSGEQMMAVVHAARDRAAEVPASLHRLAAMLGAMGVGLGSHDDPDPATRSFYAGIGARICEFPIRQEAAAAARLRGDPILMGAPNVVRGGSQAGNIAARDLIAAELCDALVSDYHYPALAQAAFALVDAGLADLPSAWAMISTNPARIIGLTDRGEIAPGRRADLVILDPATRTVEATISGGRIAHLAGGVAARFLNATAAQALAAE